MGRVLSDEDRRQRAELIRELAHAPRLSDAGQERLRAALRKPLPPDEVKRGRELLASWFPQYHGQPPQ